MCADAGCAVEVETKVCVTCAVEKPIDEFGFYKKGKRRTKCRLCFSEQNKKAVKEYTRRTGVPAVCDTCGESFVKSKWKSGKGKNFCCKECHNSYHTVHIDCLPEKTCTRCMATKPIEDFGVDSRREGKKVSWCKKCAKEYQLSVAKYVVSECCFCGKSYERTIDEARKSERDGTDWFCSRTCLAKRSGQTRRERIRNRTEKKCGQCKQVFPLAEFGSSSKSVDGLGSVCKKCSSFNGKKFQIKRKYGMTLDDLEDMRSAQGHRCAMCNSEEEASPRGVLYIDHDHDTGAVRGLLCSNCNSAFGMFKEDVGVLEMVIRYKRNGGFLDDDWYDCF